MSSSKKRPPTSSRTFVRIPRGDPVAVIGSYGNYTFVLGYDDNYGLVGGFARNSDEYAGSTKWLNTP